MLIIALAVKISSPGPIIFKQTRLGLKGRRFPFYKYRSMYWNGDDQIHREYVSNLIEGQLEKINKGEKGNPFFKIKDDYRITRVGKIIRKLSIDELPQFFNVLKGEMSLVGPRPPIPYEVEKYKPWHLRRILEMKAGITGLWQVSGRSKTTFDEMVRLDLRYVQNWSIWLDLKILFKTVKEVIHPHNAA
jgi:lipopolysaccharide/colanic/teichoic acid biosynthesis glycosyltransferase